MANSLKLLRPSTRIQCSNRLDDCRYSCIFATPWKALVHGIQKTPPGFRELTSCGTFQPIGGLKKTVWKRGIRPEFRKPLPRVLRLENTPDSGHSTSAAARRKTSTTRESTLIFVESTS